MNGKPLRKVDVHRILDEMMAELDESYQVFFKIRNNEVDLYTPNPGVVIGRAGTRINKYETLLKEVGVSKVNIIDVEAARMPDYSYVNDDEW